MQYARPSSDVENPGGWATEPLWVLIDEEPFDDADYIESPRSATNASFTIGLSGITDPEVHTDHVIRIRIQTGVSGTFKYELMQGAVVIKDSGDIVLTTAFAEYNMTLSEAEAAEITDYSTLRVRVTAVATQKNQRQRISWIRVDVPDLAGEEHSGTGSISGNGSATSTIKKGGLGSAIKSAGGTLLALGFAGMLGITSITGGGAQLGVGEKSVGTNTSISGNGSQAVIGKKETSGSGSVSGGGSLTATGSKAEGEPHSGTALISGTGAIAGVATKQVLGDSPVTGGGSIIASGEAVEHHFSTASVSGNGTLSEVGEKQASGDSVTSGGGLIIVTGQAEMGEHSGVIIISGNGTLIASGMKSAEGMGVVSGGGTIVVGKEEDVIPPIKPKVKTHKISNELRYLEGYKEKKKVTRAQLADDMTRFGWQWTEDHLDALLSGKMKISADKQEFIRRYLLTRYYNENLSQEA